MAVVARRAAEMAKNFMMIDLVSGVEKREEALMLSGEREACRWIERETNPHFILDTLVPRHLSKLPKSLFG